MTPLNGSRPANIMLIEDNPGDIRLTLVAFEEAKVKNEITVARDGVEAMAMLRGEAPHRQPYRPDLILLDLNLPRLDGRSVLSQIKNDPDLHHIPVVVLTSSKDENDIVASYELMANCYVSKPVDLEAFVKIVQSIDDFWFSIVRLPRR